MNLGTIAEINKALAGYLKVGVSSLADLEPGMLGKFGAAGRSLLYQFVERVEETQVKLGVVAVENAADQSQVGREVVASENELLRPGWTWFKFSGQARTNVAAQVTSGGKPLPGAIVALWGGLPPFVAKVAEVQTDAQGMARFENVALLPGMAFKVTRSGYQEKNVVAVQNGMVSVPLVPGGFGFRWWMLAVPAGLAGGIWVISRMMSKKAESPVPAVSGLGSLYKRFDSLRDRRDAVEKKVPSFRVELPSEDAVMDGRSYVARDLRRAERKIAKAEKCLKEIEEA